MVYLGLSLAALFTIFGFLDHGSQERSRTVMTKRTAALVAASKISSKARKVAGDSGGVAKKPTPEDTKKSRTIPSVDIPSNLPWFNIFTKSDPEYDTYMATEWGMEKRGDVALFEKICLEGAQSGLSWLTILRKRDAYRKAFHNFDVSKVATMTDKDIQNILDADEADPRNMIVRHRGKIEATINNAKCIQKLYESAAENEAGAAGKHGVFDSFLWSFVEDKPILNTKWKHGGGLTDALTKSPESEAMSKALKKRGFRFVGPTTCYAMMQAVGMVIDHPAGSPEWHVALERLEKRPGGYQKDTDRNSSTHL